MTNNKILATTLKENGFEEFVNKGSGFWNTIIEAMDRARYDHAEKVVKEIERRSLKIGFFDADSERATSIIRKIK
jgi:hypothetical protein